MCLCACVRENSCVCGSKDGRERGHLQFENRVGQKLLVERVHLVLASWPNVRMNRSLRYGVVFAPLYNCTRHSRDAHPTQVLYSGLPNPTLSAAVCRGCALALDACVCDVRALRAASDDGELYIKARE